MPPAPTGLATADPQAQKLLTQMTRLDGHLRQIERQVLAWARAPLSPAAPLEDLEGRMRSHQVGERGRRRKRWPCPGAAGTKSGTCRGSHGTEAEEGNAQPRSHSDWALPGSSLTSSGTLGRSLNLSGPWFLTLKAQNMQLIWLFGG